MSTASTSNDTEGNHSWFVAWWLRLDGGWRATLLGLVVIVCVFVVGGL